jgi:hypothetical protein
VEQPALVDRVRAAAADPGVRRAFDTILDRRERTGRLPATVTIDADAATFATLRAVFSPHAVAAVEDGRVRIHLRRVTGVLALDALLYAALERAPRDPAAERSGLRTELLAALARLPAPQHAAARAFLDADRAEIAVGHGETWLVAERHGAARAALIVADVTRALDALLELRAPIRTANFAARVLGDSKALAAGGERVRRLAAALLAHDLATQAEVALGQPASPAAAAAAALEARGLLRDDAGVLVHAFGPLVYARAGAAAPFDHVARHAALGEPSPLSAGQLRDASLVALPAARITIFENQAPFLDYVERADPARELVVFARGQASWAVVMLLRLCAPARLPVRHAGDLDRSGVHILRSLARRARVAIEPWHMDVSTHRRFAGAGRPIDAEERGRLARLLAVDAPTEPCHELLHELHTTGVWIEQEAFSHLLLVPDGDVAARTTYHDDNASDPV